MHFKHLLFSLMYSSYLCNRYRPLLAEAYTCDPVLPLAAESRVLLEPPTRCKVQQQSSHRVCAESLLKPGLGGAPSKSSLVRQKTSIF